MTPGNLAHAQRVLAYLDQQAALPSRDQLAGALARAAGCMQVVSEVLGSDAPRVSEYLANESLKIQRLLGGER